MDNGLYNNLREKLTYQKTLDLDEEGVRDLLRELLDKESTMKPLLIHGEYTCPMCEREVGYSDRFCWHCGKNLYWED